MTRYEEMIQKLSQGPVINNAAQFQSRWEQTHARPTTTAQEPQQKGGLEGLLGGIGDTLGAVGNTIKDTVGAVGSIFTTQATNTMRDNLTKQAKDARDKVAKQFGYESYSSAPDEAWDNQNFVAAIKAVNAREQEGLNKIREGYNNDWFRKNTAEVKQGDYGSNALKTMNAAMDVAQMAYGGGGPIGLALNGVQGYMSSLADDLKGKDTVFDLEGRINGKPQETDTVDWGKVGKEGTANAAAGIAGGLAGDFTGRIGGKLLGSNNILGRLGGKALASAPIRGAISGGVGGATGAYTNTRLNGGTLEEALANSAAAAGQGAGQGALMSTGMSLLGKGINKAKNAYANNKQQKLINEILEQETLTQEPTNRIANTEEVETEQPINRVARPTEDKVYASQFMEDADYGDGIKSVKLNNDDIYNSVAKSTGVGDVIDDKDLLTAILNSTPEEDPTGTYKQLLPQETRDLITENLESQSLTPKSYKKSVAQKLTDFVLGEGNQGTENIYYQEDGKTVGGRRISNNSKTYKMLYDEYGGKPSKEFISATVDAYLDGKMSKATAQQFENALEWDRQAFDNPNIPSKDFRSTYEKSGLNYDNLQKALENDPTLRTKINKSLLDNSEIAQEAIANDRLNAAENANQRQAKIDADYEARKAVAQAQADEINRANGWDEYEQYIKEVNAKNKSQTIPKISRERSPATDEDIYNNSKSRSYRKKEAEALLKQYNTVDKKTANSTDPEDTVLKLKDMGFSKKSKIEDISGKITGKDGKVSGLVKKVIENASPVDTTTGPEGYASMDDYVEDLIAENGLLGLPKGEATRTQVKAIMNKLPTHREGTIDFVDEGSEVFKVVQKLESAAAEKRGKSGTTYATASDESLAQANVLEGVADELRNRLFDNADVSKVLTPDVAEELKSYDPNNAKWADYVDNTIMKAQDARQLRSAQSPWVRINKIIENGDMNQITYGGRVGNAVNIPTTETSIKNRAINAVANKILGSDFVINKKADYYENQARKAAEAAPQTTTTATEPAQNIAPQSVTPQNITSLPYAMIGRIAGQNTKNTLEEQLAGLNTQNASQAAMNGLNGAYYSGSDIYGNSTTPTAYGAENNAQTNAGTDMINRIQLAMELALEAGDLKAVSQLVDIYNDWAKIMKAYETEEPKQTKLTATQQRANAAASSLQRLSSMTPDTGYTVSGIPILGDIVNMHGNSYLSEAQSLAQQIGYMVSGANIKKEEAEAIGRAYVPQPFDSEQIRNEKLQRAAEIIRMYQNGYTEE